MSQLEQLPELSSEDIRVLGALMEKELTTPDNYPLTLNSLTLACNQKSNREPTMQLSEGEVGHIASLLEDRMLVRIDRGQRADRISHKLARAWQLDRPKEALLCVMMLRRPQTLNELKTRTQRMVEFAGQEDIQTQLDELMARDPALVRHLAKGPGQREDRYWHLLGDHEAEIPAFTEKDTAPAPGTMATSKDLDRVDQLEQRVSELEDQIGKLLQRFEDDA